MPFPPRTAAPPPPRTQVAFRAINDYSRVMLIAQVEGMKFARLAHSVSTAEFAFARRRPEAASPFQALRWRWR